MIRSLTEAEVTALHDLADNGPMHCECESSAELCHCSTIMMLCDEWQAMRGVAQGPLRDALEQIKSVCIDNAGLTVRHDLALKFVGDVAEHALHSVSSTDGAIPKACASCQNTGWCHARNKCVITGKHLRDPSAIAQQERQS